MGVRAIALALIAALAIATPVAAQGGGGQNAVTIGASPTTVKFGQTTTFTGQLTGPGNAGERVELQANPAPMGGGFNEVAEATTDASGNYAFAHAPTVNTIYRVRARTSPPTTSPELAVNVAPRVSLGVSDRTPEAGTVVTFRGAVRPPHDGAVVQIQRRQSDGSFRTVRTTTLVDAGDVRSTYSKRVRVNRDGVFRAVLPGHDDHVEGKSRRKRVDVH
jgi:hypothetical protein